MATSKTNLIGYRVRLQFAIGQHSRDTELLNSFTRYFYCGTISVKTNLSVCIYRVKIK